MSEVDPVVSLGAQVLRVAVDFDSRIARNPDIDEALDFLRNEPDIYNRSIVEELAQTAYALPPPADQERLIALKEAQPGMIFAEDAKLFAGLLVISRGHVVTPVVAQRLRSLEDDAGDVRVRFIVPQA